MKRKGKGAASDGSVSKKRRKECVTAGGRSGIPADPLFSYSSEWLEIYGKISKTEIREHYDRLTELILSAGGSDRSQARVQHITDRLLGQPGREHLLRTLQPISTAGQIRSALRLLTACVTSGPATAGIVLAKFPFGNKTLPQIATVRNLNADSDVRTAFVDFVLSFLIDKQRLIIEGLIEKLVPLRLVLSGLNTDRSATIHLVLSTLKSTLLENPKITKQDKMKVFNARLMGPVLELYRWRGHRLVWKSRGSRKQKKPGRADVEEGDGEDAADPEELQQVRRNAHEFLTTLFTSYSRGIAFRDVTLGTSGNNNNPVLLDLLKLIPAPWRDQLTAHLVVETLSVCPDLCHHYWPLLSAPLAPRVSAEWRGAVAMATASVAGRRLALPAGEAERLTPQAVCRAAEACLYPAAFRDTLTSGVFHEEVSVREPSLHLLATVLQQVCALQDQVLQLDDYGPEVRAALSASIAPVLPPCGRLTQQWLRLAPTGGSTELVLLLRVLALCARTCDTWQVEPTQLVRVQSGVAELEVTEDLRIQLTAALQLLQGTNCSSLMPGVSRPRKRKLTSSTVPEILAEIVGSAEETAKPAPSAAPDADADPEASDSQPAAEISGSSWQQQLESYLPAVLSALRGREIAQLCSLGSQLAGLRVSSDCRLPADWPGFVRLAVKLGLRHPELGCVVFPQLCQLELLHPCTGNEPASDPVVSVETLYQLLLGHSHCLDLMLDPDQSQLPLRDHLLRLLLLLATRCQHVCRASHLALFLAAYGATLSTTDQLIVQLIGVYERSGVSLHSYQPMLWGSAALSFYSPTKGGGSSLKSQPSPDEVLGLLDPEKMAATCQHLPLKISLQLSELPCQPGVYDVRFLLPVLIQLTAVDQPCDAVALIGRGVLALLVSCLSCRQAAVRAAAWAVLARLYQQLHNSKHKRLKLVWLTFIDLLRGAVRPDQRLPFVITHTWARFIQILHDPGHKLFHKISRLLLWQARSGQLEVSRVPLFYELFNSASPLEHRWEHGWMVEHLTQSVREMADYGALHRTVTYKLVMGLAGSSLATHRQQLIKLLEVTARLPAALLDLEYRHGLSVWLCAQLPSLCRSASTRSALAALAAQMVLTLRARRRRPLPAAFVDRLETFLMLFARQLTNDTRLSVKVNQCLSDLNELKLSAAT